jgi:hypothetical protein
MTNQPRQAGQPEQYLLNKNAYQAFTGQDQTELFKKIALKRTTLTIEELQKLNPTNKNEDKSIKVFQYDDVGMCRVFYIKTCLAKEWSKHLSMEAVLEGKQAAGY